MLKVFYFAYGSNLLFERMQQRLDRKSCKVKKLRTHVLKDYDLVLDCGIEHFNFVSFANIVPKVGSEVEGVLYELDHRQCMELDRCEGLYERQYFMIPEGIAFTYISPYTSDMKPDRYYLDILIEGCLENNLIATYNKLVNFRIKNYKLKGGSKYKPIVHA